MVFPKSSEDLMDIFVNNDFSKCSSTTPNRPFPNPPFLLKKMSRESHPHPKSAPSVPGLAWEQRGPDFLGGSPWHWGLS